MLPRWAYVGRIIATMDTNQQMKPTDYFDRHPVFRFDDFAAAHAAGGRRSRQTTASVLKQHVAAGRLLHVRRGLYTSVPRGADPERHPVDPYLLATQLAPDGVVINRSVFRKFGIKVAELVATMRKVDAG